MKKNMKFKARDKSIGQEDAQVYGEYIYNTLGDGEITPHQVLEISKDKKAPTHKFFEWDNIKASNNWRIHQARILIRTIAVEITDDDGNKVEQRAWFNIKDNNDEHAYVHINTVQKNKDYRKQVIDNAMKSLMTWQFNYESYKDWFGNGIFVEIKKLKDKFKY